MALCGHRAWHCAMAICGHRASQRFKRSSSSIQALSFDSTHSRPSRHSRTTRSRARALARTRACIHMQRHLVCKCTARAKLPRALPVCAQLKMVFGDMMNTATTAAHTALTASEVHSNQMDDDNAREDSCDHNNSYHYSCDNHRNNWCAGTQPIATEPAAALAAARAAAALANTAQPPATPPPGAQPPAPPPPPRRAPPPPAPAPAAADP